MPTKTFLPCLSLSAVRFLVCDTMCLVQVRQMALRLGAWIQHFTGPRGTQKFLKDQKPALLDAFKQACDEVESGGASSSTGVGLGIRMCAILSLLFSLTPSMLLHPLLLLPLLLLNQQNQLQRGHLVANRASVLHLLPLPPLPKMQTFPFSTLVLPRRVLALVESSTTQLIHVMFERWWKPTGISP